MAYYRVVSTYCDSNVFQHTSVSIELLGPCLLFQLNVLTYSVLLELLSQLSRSLKV